MDDDKLILHRSALRNSICICTCSLRQLLVSLEKKITKNQKMRMKFADAPDRFMESEVELHEELQDLFAVAASPELYPVLVQSGAVGSLLGLLTHENTDVSLTVISLLHEMIDADSISDELDNALEFIKQFVDQQGLELLVQNLYRLNEDSDEDAQGVHDTLSILEALVDLLPQQVAVPICEKTHILKFLLDRCRAKTFDANKLSCSELLSILLQADPTNQTLLCGLQGVDGMDSLLQCIAVYRKRDVAALDEQVGRLQLFSPASALFLSVTSSLSLPLSLSPHDLPRSVLKTCFYVCVQSCRRGRISSNSLPAKGSSCWRGV